VRVIAAGMEAIFRVDSLSDIMSPDVASIPPIDETERKLHSSLPQTVRPVHDSIV